MPPQRPKQCANQKSGERRHQGPISFLKSDGTGGLCRSCGKTSMGHTTRVARRAGAKSFGNTKKGMSKRKAGKRSGIRRKAKIALVVKKPWIDYLLNGSKTWEVRGSATKRRGWIHLAESGSGKLIGGAKLIDCIHVPRSEFLVHRDLHRVPALSLIKYKTIYAWVFRDARRYGETFNYVHAPGAVVWVRA